MDRITMNRHIHAKLIDTYERKNHDYGDSFVKVREKYPEAIMIRLMDKLNRLEVLLKGNRAMVKDESVKDTLSDLANYAIMELVEISLAEHEKANKDPNTILQITAENMRIKFCKEHASRDFCHKCQIGRNTDIEQISCQQWVEHSPEQAIQIMRKVGE